MRQSGMKLKTVTILDYKGRARTITVCAKKGGHHAAAERYFRGGKKQ